MIVLVVDESNLVASLRGVLALWKLGEQLLKYMHKASRLPFLTVIRDAFPVK